MAIKYTIYTYRCPRCRADIGHRFGLLTTLTITCASCQTKARLTAMSLPKTGASTLPGSADC